MAALSLVSGVEPVADIKLGDDAPLAISQLSKVDISKLPLIGDLQKPVDQCSFEEVELGLKINAPERLVGTIEDVSLSATNTATLSVHNSKCKTLFEDDGFSPRIDIAASECWVGLQIETLVTNKLKAEIDGFGVAIAGSASIAATTHVRLQSAAGKLPTLQAGISSVLESYAFGSTPQAIRNQALGIAREVETTGTVKFSGSYSLPVNVNALASAGLPFNYKLSLTPKATLEIDGSISLKGEFIVRSIRTAATTLLFGVYKKKETVFEVGFDAAAGLAGELGKTDILSAFLETIAPSVKVEAAGFGEEQTKALTSALNDCADASLGVALNGSCSASKANEAAIVYEIDLALPSMGATDAALKSALAGDWTPLDALSNAKKLRNICKESHDQKHAIAINLCGFYNAEKVEDYLKSCAILHDQNGQIVLIDKQRASAVQLVGMPYRANKDKLRMALAQEFLGTLTYAASASSTLGPKLRLEDFTVQQTYDRYDAETSYAELRRGILLGTALGLLTDVELSPGQSFTHARCSVSAAYNLTAAARLFFANPTACIPYSREQLERAGRAAMASLIDSGDINGPERLQALNDDAIWAALNQTGNTGIFRTVPGLQGFNQTAIGAIATDWMDITGWSYAMDKVAPKLTQVLQALEISTSPDPTSDSKFMQSRKDLEDVLAKVSQKTRASFAEGWGLLVMYRLSSGAPALRMDLAWNSEVQHYESVGKPAAPPALHA